MLSKEEIEKLKELSHYCASKNIGREDNVFGEFVVIIQKVKNYIEQQETDKQKLIEKLEEDIINIEKQLENSIEMIINEEEDKVTSLRTELFTKQEILKIVKGEKE